MCKGWIKSYRSILEWEWWGDHNTTILWIYLLHAVNYESKKWRGLTIEPGQIITSRESLSEATCLSQQQIRTALTKLKSTSNITIKTTSRYTLVTVVKWQDYQEQLTKQSTSNPPDEQPTDNQQSTTTKEIKNLRNKDINTTTDIDEISQIFHEWEKASGQLLSPLQNELIIALYEQHGLEKILFAITEAARNNAVKISYVEAILKGEGKKKKNGLFKSKTEKPQKPSKYAGIYEAVENRKGAIFVGGIPCMWDEDKEAYIDLDGVIRAHSEDEQDD